MKLGGADSGLIHSAGVTPEVGNQCRVKEKMSMRTSPIQKVGSENVVRDAVTQALSNMLPLLRAARVPRKIPTTIAMTDETPSKRSVFSSLPDWTISCMTGLPV